MLPNPSELQQAVLRFVREQRGNAFIEAVAGAGKTTSLLHILSELEKLRPGSRVALVAFNVAIKDELEAKVTQAKSNGIAITDNIKMATCHALGMGCCFKLLPGKPQVDGNKKRKIFEKLVDEKVFKQYASFVPKLVGFAQNSGLGVLYRDDYQGWLRLINHHDMEVSSSIEDDEDDLIDRGIMYAKQLLEETTKEAMQHCVIDFDDMIYLPVKFKCFTRPYDFILPDEAQDLSPMRIALIEGLLSKRGGRLFAVGDRNQAIYGFSGAGVDSVDQIIKKFNCVSLPLNVCYRCDKSIIAEAQRIVPHIEAAEGKDDGEVVCSSSDKYDWQNMEQNSAVLCRYTAPLMKQAYALMAMGKPCYVVGRDIGEGLIKLVKKMRSETIDELEFTLDEYFQREYDKLSGSEEKAGKLESLEDRVEAVKVLIDALPEPDRTVPRLLQNINDLFSDEKHKDKITLSSVHRAKGREWPKVAILAYSAMPSKRATLPWQIEQEHNLIYVAVTRAEHKLHLLD